MRFRVIVPMMSFFLMQFSLYAQRNAYQFSHLDITNGLSNNQVNCIYKDVNGFMWFGTNSGLNRYDGYKFKVYKHDPADGNSLSGNFVNSIYEGPDRKMWVYTHNGISVYDPETERFSNDIRAELQDYKIVFDQVNSIKKDTEGKFWFLTQDDGIYRYDEAKKTSVAYNTSGTSKIILHSNHVSDVVGSPGGVVWVIYRDGFIDKLDTRTNLISLRINTLNRAYDDKPKNYLATLDKAGNLWVYSNDSFNGVYCYDTQVNKLMHFDKDTPGIRLNSNVINSIVQGEDNNLWIGTDHGGINLVDETTHKVSYLLSRDDDAKSLGGNSVVLYKDNTGIIWAGTYKQGVSYFHKDIIQFSLTRHYDSNPESLPYEDVDCFVEDAKGNLWIGTNGGGLIFYYKATKKYTQFKHDPGNSKSLSNDVVISLCIDHTNKLWVGTYFGGLDRMDQNTFTHYRHQDGEPASISDDRVYSIIEDSSQKLWAGTFAGGLNIYDRATDSFLHPHYKMMSDYTSMLYEDKQKNIWIGRDRGIDVIDGRTNQVKHYFNEPRNPNSLIANDVNKIIQDKTGLMWIGTKDGISILNTKTGRFLNIDESKGLPNNNISNILEDKNGLIWISTANGLASMKLTRTGSEYQYQVHKYNELDGLQGKEYNLSAAYRTRSGDMMFGGAHGFNIFNPENMRAVVLKPRLIFTDLQLFNKSVRVGDTVEGKVLLSRSITEAPSLVLKHDENVFSIEFAACDYFNPDKITYQYKLEGFDKEWLYSPKDSRKVTYTNLDAGDYTFKVRSGNTNDPKNISEAALTIKILPPFWKTPLAYVCYLAAILGILFYIRHRGIQKIKRGFELKQAELEAERKIAKEREEAHRMHELDLMKIKFFTNVSHEFRTPLSLIISPIDNLIKKSQQPENQQQLLLIKRNGKRLLNLVNQLLDFRKMEFKELKLNLAKGDIIQFIKEVCSSFSDLAEQNRVNYMFDNDIESIITRFDHDKIERVLFNLLSNSFKFTSPGGYISVFLTLSGDYLPGEDQQMLEIKIIDTGIGIPKEKHERIFDRFFQDNLPEGLLNQGSGIGLSISREFIKMHGGDIYVESEPGDGSCFTICLPVGIESEKINSTTPAEKANGNSPKSVEQTLESGKKPVILLIEDNDDLRFYLKDNLKQTFTIIEAANGKDGWQKTLALHPHLIVSDVNMPEMNGIDLCTKIRQDERTAHIPIILLTALTDEGDQIAGTASGANDYITKPFNFEILLSKINGLLVMQQTLKKTYQKLLEIKGENLEIVSEDEKFLKNALSCIEKNITNPNFSVEELSRQMSLSRVSLYKRLLTLTGKTPVDCIRTIRLKRAVQLLEKSKLSIASVAFEVGFNNPHYFSKVFKEEYGTLPSEYLNEVRKREKENLQPTNEFE